MQSAKGQTKTSIFWYAHQNIVSPRRVFVSFVTYWPGLTYIRSRHYSQKQWSPERAKMQKDAKWKVANFRITHHSDKRKSNGFAGLVWYTSQLSIPFLKHFLSFFPREFTLRTTRLFEVITPVLLTFSRLFSLSFVKSSIYIYIYWTYRTQSIVRHLNSRTRGTPQPRMRSLRCPALYH